MGGWVLLSESKDKVDEFLWIDVMDEMQLNETSFGKPIKTHKMRWVLDKYDPFDGMNFHAQNK
jgi:hypothetical protein